MHSFGDWLRQIKGDHGGVGTGSPEGLRVVKRRGKRESRKRPKMAIF